MSKNPLDTRSNPQNALQPGNIQAVTIGSSSTQSTAFGPSTTWVEVCATVACWLAFGTDPEAQKAEAGSLYLPASVPRDYSVNPGDKIAVIEDSGGGTLSITEAM